MNYLRKVVKTLKHGGNGRPICAINSQYIAAGNDADARYSNSSFTGAIQHVGATALRRRKAKLKFIAAGQGGLHLFRLAALPKRIMQGQPVKEQLGTALTGLQDMTQVLHQTI